jgi:hypothetical protein
MDEASTAFWSHVNGEQRCFTCRWLGWLTPKDLHLRVKFGAIFDVESSLWNHNEYREFFHILEEIFLPGEWQVLWYGIFLPVIGPSIGITA